MNIPRFLKFLALEKIISSYLINFKFLTFTDETQKYELKSFSKNHKAIKKINSTFEDLNETLNFMDLEVTLQISNFCKFTTHLRTLKDLFCLLMKPHKEIVAAFIGDLKEMNKFFTA